MSVLRVEASTPLCQLQDAGRFGVRQLGVTQGGALDWVAMHWANWLLGNPLGAPVVEVALGGFCVVAEQDCVLALAGADLDACVDDQPLAPWRSFALAKGQRLTLKQPKVGVRAYLAAPGGFLGEEVLGSCATVVREALGGIDGQGAALAKHQALAFTGSSAPLREVPHALLTRQLLTPNWGAGTVHLVYAASVPPLWYQILTRGWMAWGPLLLALLAWLWMRTQRLGPVLPAPPVARRALLEHVAASGEHLVRYGRAPLLYDAVRTAFLDRLRRRDPLAAALVGEAGIEAIASRTGV